MNQKVKVKVFYTPVKEDKIELIQISSKDELQKLEEYTKKLFFNKKISSNGYISELKIKEKSLIDLLNSLSVENSNKKNTKKIFDILKEYSYSRSKEGKRYWCLMISKNFLIIYHFTPDKSVTFERRKIKEFIKYLDNSTVNRSIIKTNKSYVKKFYDKQSKRRLCIDRKEINLSDLDQDGILWSVYDRNKSKGFAQLVHSDINYDQKGDVKIRVKRTDKTDVVIETYIDDLKNINSNIKIDFESNKASITLNSGEITEIKIVGKKFKDGNVAINYITYLNLELDKFFYDNKEVIKNKGKIIEKKELITIQGNDINKPDKGLENKEETIFIWSDESEYPDLVKECIDSIRNNLNIGFVEIANFNENYKKVELGHFSVFAEFKESDDLQTFLNRWNLILDSLKNLNNSTYEKILNLISLKILSTYFSSKKLTEKFNKFTLGCLNDIFNSGSYSKLDFKEYSKDYFVIELKSGVKHINGKNEGFFINSPEKFANRVIENVSKENKKKAGVIIYIIGIDETTKDFSLIPMSGMRSEFIEFIKNVKIKTEETNSFNVRYIDAIPVKDKKGILMLVLEKNYST